MEAFDYTTQRWLTGLAGAREALRQLDLEIEDMSGPRGPEILDFVRKQSEPRRTVAEVLRNMRSHRAYAIAEIEGDTK